MSSYESYRHKIVEYLSEGFGFIQNEIGRHDLSNVIILVNDYDDWGDEILGCKVFAGPYISGTVDIAFPYPLSAKDKKALKAWREYLQLYDIEDE
jgi:hypothetical protein